MVQIRHDVYESRSELDSTRPNLLGYEGSRVHAGTGGGPFASLKKGIRYLRGRTDLGLVYDFRKQPPRTGVYGFFDASHADDVDTRKSTIA